jgi:GNAT superfamily N-acetyltransferase
MRETIFQPVFGMKDVDERLRRGERCFVCEDGDRIAGYIWFSTAGKHIGEIGATLQLRDGDVYAYNAYVDQEYRGRNITPSILAAAGRVFLREGFRRLLLVTMNWNENTHRALKKADFLRAGDLSAGYFATFRFFVNSCRDVAVSRDAGPFTFYGKLFRKIAAALSRGAVRGRMV